MVERSFHLFIILVLSLTVTANVSATDFYVSPTGTPSGDGSIGNPWDLRTALSHPGNVAPGDTIFVRGGVYTGRYSSALTGTASAPIIVKPYQQEVVIIDGHSYSVLTQDVASAAAYSSMTIRVADTSGFNQGGTILIDKEPMQISARGTTTLTVNRGWGGGCVNSTCPTHLAGARVYSFRPTMSITGGYTHFQGFIVTNSYPSRVSGQAGSSPHDIPTGHGYSVYSPGIKIINNVIYDSLGDGIAAWVGARDSEYYGNVVYNNGWWGPDRGHGHGIYTQNQYGVKTFKNNIVLHNFGLVLQQYGSSQAYLDNYMWINNTLYSGMIQYGGGAPMNNLTLIGNFFYGSQPNIGYSNPGNNNINITGNYFGASTLGLSLSRNVSVTNNTFITGTPVRLNYNAVPTNVVTDYQFSANTYQRSTSSWPYQLLHVSGEITPDVDPTNCRYFWFNKSQPGYGYCGGNNAWQETLGYDLDGAYTQSPLTNKYIVMTNQYDANRAHLIIYNWERRTTVNVDVSNILISGDTYAIHQVADYANDVITGTYQGGLLSIPMTGHTTAIPLNFNTTLGSHSFPEFGAFTIIKTSGISTNLAPTANAGADQATANALVQLAGSGTDDGPSLTYAWSLVSGPGTVAFSGQIPAPIVTLSAIGQYILRLTVSDGQLSASDDMIINYAALIDTTPPSVVNGLVANATAGSARLFWLAATDNVGVTGYRITRCTGVGCSPTMNIGNSTALAFQDSVSPATYAYGVAAYDAAGNTGAMSTTGVIVPAGARTGDVTGDGVVNILDLQLVSQNVGSSLTTFDLNTDGIVNIFDMMIVIKNWG